MPSGCGTDLAVRRFTVRRISSHGKFWVLAMADLWLGYEYPKTLDQPVSWDETNKVTVAVGQGTLDSKTAAEFWNGRMSA